MEANTEANRLQIFFDEKPDAATREELKSNGFRWSPKAEAWQRQLTLQQSGYPVFLVPCNRTGMIQLRLLAIPHFREVLSQAALQGQYQPPDNPLWDATFQGLPFLVAVDMDLHRLDAAITAAQKQGFPSVAMVALAEQAKAVLHTRYRDTSLARVFTLTEEALASVLGPAPIPYTDSGKRLITAQFDNDKWSVLAPGRNSPAPTA